MESSNRSRRTTNACQRCRARKVKCSGTHPCEKCHHRQQECIFEEDRKIVVSEELFLSLKRKVDDLEGSPAAPQSKRFQSLKAHFESPVNSGSLGSTAERNPETHRTTPLEQQDQSQQDERFARNPLVSPSTYVKHNGRRQRQWLLLGPTSTWSFSRRVLSTVQSRLDPASDKSIPLAVDGDAYKIHWNRMNDEDIPDISGLPSLHQAIYMSNTVRFHLDHLYHLFNEDEFLQNLHEFYHDAAAKVQSSRLWYVQFLVILAFAEALLVPVRKTSNTPSWTKYFSRAMSLLPDTTALWQEPILAIEVLGLVSLYLHSVDMRDSAYCYIGHAMRMVLVEGLHRALPVEQLGEKCVERCSRIWWTVYILDRKFSYLIGSPNSVNDEDITTALWDPRTCSEDAAALSLHVKITQVITRVLNMVYSPDGKLGTVFLQRIRSILHEMTDLSQELEDVFARRFSDSVDALSGVTTRLTLSCHLCIIVTARPLILTLLWERLSCYEEGSVFRDLSSPARILMQACIDSATKSLKLLTALQDQNLLETFLPFDLENLFSSFFILSVISTILPNALPDLNYREIGFSLLDDLIARGNRVAELRKSEIELLEELMQPLLQLQEQHAQIDVVPLENEPQDREVEANTAAENRNSVSPVHTATSEEDLLFDWRDFGMSLTHMLSATDQLNTSSILHGEEDQLLSTDLWLWSDS